MNQHILDRYQRTDGNEIIIEVTAEKVEDLYNNFDRNAPYIKKDLDDELADYLVNSISEIGKEEFIIRFCISHAVDSELASRVRDSVKNYFQYMLHLENRDQARMLRKSIIFLITGLLILFIDIMFRRQSEHLNSLSIDIFIVGMTVAAWVALWEALANVLVHWAPHYQMRKNYERLMNARLFFE